MLGRLCCSDVWQGHGLTHTSYQQPRPFAPSAGNAFCFAAGVCHRIRKAFFAGDLATARIEQGRVNAFVNVLTDARYGGNLLTTARQVMELKGIKMGPPRQPHVPLTPAQATELEAELNKIGFFSWCD